MWQHLEIVERSSANKRTRVPLEAADLLLREAIGPTEAAQAFLESCVRDGNSDLDRNVADIAHRGEERLVRVLQAGSEARAAIPAVIMRSLSCEARETTTPRPRPLKIRPLLLLRVFNLRQHGRNESRRAQVQTTHLYVESRSTARMERACQRRTNRARRSESSTHLCDLVQLAVRIPHGRERAAGSHERHAVSPSRSRPQGLPRRALSDLRTCSGQCDRYKGEAIRDGLTGEREDDRPLAVLGHFAADFLGKST